MVVLSELIILRKTESSASEIIHWLQRQSLTILRRMEISTR